MTSADFLSLVIAILLGSLTAYIAKGRGRSPGIWFFIGMFFGIFGLIALFFFPIIKLEGDLPSRRQMPPPAITPPPLVETACPLTSRDWFFLDREHKQLGPEPLAKLQELWRAGTIAGSTYVWCEGMENWKKIDDISLLLSRLTT
jgi:hypothetical protein